MRRLPSFVLVCVALFLTSQTEAQGGIRTGERIDVQVEVSLEYDGVRPGSGHLPPRARAIARNGAARLVTWPGFEAHANGSSRFFLQTSIPVAPEVRIQPGRVTVLLPNTRVHVWNNYNPLETRYFDTPVLRAYLRPRGRHLVFVMELRAEVTPRITVQSGEHGFHFVMIDFE